MEKTLKRFFWRIRVKLKRHLEIRIKIGILGAFGGFGRRMGCAVKEDTKIFRFSLLCYSRPKAASEAARLSIEAKLCFSSSYHHLETDREVDHIPTSSLWMKKNVF